MSITIGTGTTTTSTNATAGTTTSTTTQPADAVGKSQLDENDFMNLFITQLQYQDPLQPMDSSQMATQMAQFSNVEATMKMSDDMEQMLSNQASQSNLQLLNLIGKNVQTQGTQIAVNSGTANQTEFTLNTPASSCTVQVTDAAGNVVRTLDEGNLAAGTYSLAWDGKDQQGNQVPDGVYNYAVNAMDANGQQMQAQTLSTGTVTGLEFDSSGQAQVTVDNQMEVSPSDILEVM